MHRRPVVSALALALAHTLPAAVHAQAVDGTGQRSSPATVRAVTPEAAPAPPTGVESAVYSSTAAELFWDRPPVPGRRHEVRRDGVVVATTDGTSHFDDTLTAARPYLFEVVSLNRRGERSAPVRLSVDTRELGGGPASAPAAGPAAPTGLRAAVYSSTAAELFWERPAAFGLVHEVRRDGAPPTRTDGTSHFDDALAGGTSYTYEIVAIDSEGRRSAPSSAMLSTPADAGPPVREASAIGVDGHVELLGHVFDVYTGNAYGPAVLALPGYSDTPEGPVGPVNLGEPFLVTRTCDNGGTAGFERIRWGSFGQTVGWVYDFDDCLDGDDAIDGLMSVADNGSERFVSAPEIAVDTPSGSMRFRGNASRLYRDLRGLGRARRWSTVPPASHFTPNAYDPTAAGVDVVLRDADGDTTFELLGARTVFGHVLPISGSLSGDFSIRSEATGGERLEVTTLEPFVFDGFAFVDGPEGDVPEHPDFDAGVLRIGAGNGDALVLDAANGDHDTVRIEITTGGVTETLTQPWSLWRERLEFDAEFLGGR